MTKPQGYALRKKGFTQIEYTDAFEITDKYDLWVVFTDTTLHDAEISAHRRLGKGWKEKYELIPIIFTPVQQSVCYRNSCENAVDVDGHCSICGWSLEIYENS